MTKTIKLSAEEIAELEKISHENDMKPAPKFKLASLKLNARDGDFFKTTLDSSKEMVVDENGRAKLENLGKTIKGTILRSRIMFTANEEAMETFTNEADRGGQFSVMVKSITEKGSVTAFAYRGTAEEIKTRFPELKYISIIYFILESTGEICRFKIHGKSLGSLFNYFKEFNQNEHIWEYTSECSYKPETNKFGKFQVLTIKRGKKVEDITVIQNAMREVNSKIEDIESYYAEKEALRAQSEEVPVIDNTLEATAEPQNDSQTPPIVPDATDTPKQGQDDGEIDVKEIPFGGKNDGDPSNEELKEAGL